VKAFHVNHGDVPQAFGYRIETPDRAIVISGDAALAVLKECPLSPDDVPPRRRGSARRRKL
jgi:hypothetical protein